MRYECKICGRTYEDPITFTSHIKNDHKLGMQEYYDKFLKKEGEGICKICGKPTKYNGVNKGYSEYCSKECSNKVSKVKLEYTEFRCEICDCVLSGNTATTAIKSFSNHLKKEHNIYNSKLYYDTYVRKENEGKCPVCGKETTFISIGKGYERFCNQTCSAEYNRTHEDSPNGRLSMILNVRNAMKKLSESITEKYNNFLKNDSKKSFGDVRTDPITHKTIKSTKQIATIDGIPTELKTEISSSTQQDPYLGTQRMYSPKRESCTLNTFSDEIMDGENSIDETEWCH